MATQLRLPANQIAEISVIGEIGPDKIKQITDRFEKLDPAPLRPDSLFVAVKEVLGSQESFADNVVRLTLSLHGMLRHSGLSAEQLFQGIRQRLIEDPDWKGEKQTRWDAVESSFRTLVCCRSVRLVTTAIDLAYEYSNLFQRARVLTDIRPIYNPQGNQIEASVISYTLRLRYDSVDGNHGLSVAMDEDDIKQLADQCNRALLKAHTARQMFSDLKLPTIISGEREHD